MHENCLDYVASILVLGKSEHGFILGQCLENCRLVVFATTCKNLLDDIIACGMKHCTIQCENNLTTRLRQPTFSHHTGQ